MARRILASLAAGAVLLLFAPRGTAADASAAAPGAPAPAESPPPTTAPQPPQQVEYPPISIRLQEEGKVLVRLLVREDGTVGGVIIVKSSGFQRLDEAAIPIVMRWRYKPAKRNGKPVAMWISAAVVFQMK